jgi:hypothetical protein
MYLAACAVAMYGFPAAAATVVPYSGDVFVSRGNGFQKIGGTTTVKVGDSVMVSPNGLAQVQLDDGNAITVSPGQVLSVPAKVRAKDLALPDGANATADLPAQAGAAGVSPGVPVVPVVPVQAGVGGIDNLLGPLVLLGGGAAIAAALATSGGGGAPTVVVPVQGARTPVSPPIIPIVPIITPVSSQ